MQQLMTMLSSQEVRIVSKGQVYTVQETFMKNLKDIQYRNSIRDTDGTLNRVRSGLTR